MPLTVRMGIRTNGGTDEKGRTLNVIVKAMRKHFPDAAIVTTKIYHVQRDEYIERTLTNNNKNFFCGAGSLPDGWDYSNKYEGARPMYDFVFIDFKNEPQTTEVKSAARAGNKRAPIPGKPPEWVKPKDIFEEE